MKRSALLALLLGVFAVCAAPAYAGSDDADADADGDASDVGVPTAAAADPTPQMTKDGYRTKPSRSSFASAGRRRGVMRNNKGPAGAGKALSKGTRTYRIRSRVNMLRGGGKASDAAEGAGAGDASKKASSTSWTAKKGLATKANHPHLEESLKIRANKPLFRKRPGARNRNTPRAGFGSTGPRPASTFKKQILDQGRGAHNALKGTTQREKIEHGAALKK